MEPVLDPDGAAESQALNVYLINVEEHLLKAHGLKHVLSLRTLEMRALHILAVCRLQADTTTLTPQVSAV